MKIFGFIGVAIAAAFAIAAPAAAADFTGPRIEARLGLDAAHINATGATASGLAFGGGIGYDLAVTKNVRLGATVAVDSSTTNQDFAGLLRADARRDIEVGARLGYVVTPATMVYGMAAYTNAQVGYSLDTSTGKFSLGHTDGDGYRVGGGVEFAATKHIFAKVEYRYSDYGHGDRRNQALTAVGFRL